MLKSLLRKRLLDDMIEGTRGSDDYVVLVVDEHTSKILSSAARVYDVMEKGVLVLENINKKREKLDIPAIYFISPHSIGALCDDFSNPIRPQYPKAHLFLPSRLDERSLELLSQSHAIPRIKTLKELNCDFVAMEARVFHLMRQEAIPRLYFNDEIERGPELKAIARQLASVCLTTNEYPYIRYDAQSNVCEYLARYVEANLNELVSNLKDWQFNANRGTLLIVDRRLEAAAPLMHEYTYQALVNDVLEVDGELLEVPTGDDSKQSTQTEVLSDSDSLWVDYKLKFFGDVLSEVPQKFRQFKATNRMATLDTGDDSKANINAMREAIAAYPEYTALTREFFKHMQICTELNNIYDHKCLEEVSYLEQDMATGLTTEGDRVNVREIGNRLRKQLANPKIDTVDKLRLLMIYVVTVGGIETDRKELMKLAGFNRVLQKAVFNLRYLGVDVTTSAKQRSQAVSKERMKRFEKHMKKSNIDLMRYTPYLLEIMAKFVREDLEEDRFPYLIAPPPKPETSDASVTKAGVSSLRKRGKWRHGSDQESKEASEHAQTAKQTGPRFITFVAGGMTFSEIRSCYEVVDNEDANLIIGSTEVLTPKKYMKDLCEMKPDENLVAQAALHDDDEDFSDDYD